MIRRLLGKSSEAEPTQTGRLVTTVEVSATTADAASPARSAVPTAAPSGPPAATLSESDLERIAARVAERLLQGPMADAVSRVVAEVSERLVREEIDRIRAAARSKV